uniref:Uncharacterized protein n=1 Tax=Arundo donax TaxID=35708 RepID=A0A0A9E3M4_ARUDO
MGSSPSFFIFCTSCSASGTSCNIDSQSSKTRFVFRPGLSPSFSKLSSQCKAWSSWLFFMYAATTPAMELSSGSCPDLLIC